MLFSLIRCSSLNLIQRECPSEVYEQFIECQITAPKQIDEQSELDEGKVSVTDGKNPDYSEERPQSEGED